jgi:hypothetical protein
MPWVDFSCCLQFYHTLAVQGGHQIQTRLAMEGLNLPKGGLAIKGIEGRLQATADRVETILAKQQCAKFLQTLGETSLWPGVFI